MSNTVKIEDFVKGFSSADARKEVRKRIIELSRRNRGKEFVVESLSDNRKISIRMNGEKVSFENGKKVQEKQDFTIHYTNEKYSLNYLDDLLIDLIKKQAAVPNIIDDLLKAVEESVHLVPYAEILDKYPRLKDPQIIQKLPGHSVEFLLKMIRWMGVQEDVNYWGTKSSGEPYEGREKPLNLLKDYFQNKMSVHDIIKKHKLYPKDQFSRE